MSVPKLEKLPNRKWDSHNQKGDLAIPKPKTGSPNQKGDPQFECRSNLGTKARFPELEQSPNQFWLVTEPIPIPKRGSRNWFGDCMIPKSVWGSHIRFGDSLCTHPPTEYGIPELVWGLHDPQIGNAGDGEDGRGEGERDDAPRAPRQATRRSRPPPKTQQSNYPTLGCGASARRQRGDDGWGGDMGGEEVKAERLRSRRR